jgi:hypothetical protein
LLLAGAAAFRLMLACFGHCRSKRREGYVRDLLESNGAKSGTRAIASS